MITNLNLASQPFRNRILPWAITTIITCVSLLALFFNVVATREIRADAERVERDLQGWRRERAALEEKAAEVRQSVPPEQLRILEAAHTLVDRKRFSWTKLFADLEAALPASVRVVRISVRDVSRRGGQTRAELELAVVGRVPDDVTGMIAEMNRAGTFSVTPRSENPRSGASGGSRRGDGTIEWTLGVSYVQRYGVLAAPSSGGADSAATASVASSALSPAPPEQQQ